MSGRGVLLLLALFALAVGVVLWVDRPPVKEEKKSEALGARLHAKLDDVAAVETERAGVTIRIERTETGWRLRRPVEAEADPRQVKSLFDAAVDATVTKVIEEKTSDPAKYGLAAPEMRLRASARGGGPAFEISIGRSSPVGAGRYVSTGDGSVLLVDGLGSSTLEKGADDFRERRFVPVDPDEIRKISVTRGAARLQLARPDKDWRLAAPVDDAADSASVDTLSRALGNLEIQQLAPGAEADKARAEAASPAVSVEVDSASGVSYRGAIAPSGPAGRRYACRTTPAGTACGTVADTSLRDLERGPDEYRDRKLVAAADGEVRGIRVERGSEVLHVSGKEAEDSGWSVQEGTAAPRDADGKKIRDFLDRLRWLSATGFAGAPSPPAFETTIVLEGASGDLGKIEVSEVGEGSKELLVRSSWRPGVVARVGAEAIGSIPRSAADLLPEAPKPAASPSPSPP